jgi:hypothetical protein
MPDQSNCQCRRRFQINWQKNFSFLAYFTCKDDIITRLQCLDKHLFDEDLRSCNDYRKVFCANRPTNEHGNDPCE